MFNLFGYSVPDKNGNPYPQIYTKAIDETSTEPFNEQINQFLAGARERGFENVDMSAYFKNGLIDFSYTYSKLAERTRKVLEDRANLPKDENDYDVVFVWNIGDITMMTRNHNEELRTLRPDIDFLPLYSLKERIFNEASLEETKITKKVDNIKDALDGETDEMREAALMYDKLAQFYNKDYISNGDNGGDQLLSHGLLKQVGLLEEEAVELLQIAKKHQQIYHRRWKHAKRSLELVNKRSAKSKTKKYANVVLCNEGIASGAADLLLNGSSKEVFIENLYSTFVMPEESNLGRRCMRTQSALERIQRRFGEKCLLIYISTDPIMYALPIIQWPVKANDSIKALFKFQRDLLH